MPESSDEDWARHYGRLAGRPPRPLFVRFREIYLAEGNAQSAIDLGCGDGTESLIMLSDGLAVTAIDGSTASIRLLSERVDPSSALTVLRARMEDVELPSVDLLYSGLTLPFCRPERFLELWERLVSCLHPGGLLALHLFGSNHGWAGEPHMTFVPTHFSLPRSRRPREARDR